MDVYIFKLIFYMIWVSSDIYEGDNSYAREYTLNIKWGQYNFKYIDIEYRAYSQW